MTYFMADGFLVDRLIEPGLAEDLYPAMLTVFFKGLQAMALGWEPAAETATPGKQRELLARAQCGDLPQTTVPTQMRRSANTAGQPRATTDTCVASLAGSEWRSNGWS
jgi:hypothetical protein